MTDGELIAAVQQGDAEAWRVLYQRWLPWVWQYAYSLVKDVHAAEDVTSEAMTVWVRQVGQTGSDAPQLAAWLRQVIHHKAVDYYRQGKRLRQVIDEVSHHYQDVDNSANPSKPLEISEIHTQLKQALDQIGETQRIVLEWKYAEGLSVREIAERLGTTEKAVEANLYRARHELREHYQRLDSGPPRRDVSNNGSDGQLSLPRTRSEI